jgi:hypothetical protein
MYLSQFGYLSAKLRNPGSGMIITEDAMKTAVSEFQSFAGINVTGKSSLTIIFIKFCNAFFFFYFNDVIYFENR